MDTATKKEWARKQREDFWASAAVGAFCMLTLVGMFTGPVGVVIGMLSGGMAVLLIGALCTGIEKVIAWRIK